MKQSNTTTAIEVRQETRDAMNSLMSIGSQASETAISLMSSADRALTRAWALREMRKALTNSPAIAAIESLQGNALGFRTDKRYTPAELVDPAIQALCWGLEFTGNEFNIIAGNLYITKEGMFKLVREWPGLTDLEVIPGEVRAAAGGTTMIGMTVKYTLDGTPCVLEQDCGVRGQGYDQIAGKGKRKALAALYEKLLGKPGVVPEGEADEAPAPRSFGTSRTEELKSKLADAPKVKGKTEVEPSLLDPEDPASPDA